MSKPKTFQVYASVMISGDGWVRAKTKAEAKEKYAQFLLNQTNGLSVMEIAVSEIFGERSRYFDHQGKPGEEDYNHDDCYTTQYLN